MAKFPLLVIIDVSNISNNWCYLLCLLITGGHGGVSIDFDIDDKISQLITRNINEKCLSYH